MEPSDTDHLRTWVSNWEFLGPELDCLRRESIRNANTQESIKAFDLAFKAVLRNNPARLTSGLLEFQRLLRKLPQQ